MPLWENACGYTRSREHYGQMGDTNFRMKNHFCADGCAIMDITDVSPGKPENSPSWTRFCFGTEPEFSVFLAALLPPKFLASHPLFLPIFLALWESISQKQANSWNLRKAALFHVASTDDTVNGLNISYVQFMGLKFYTDANAVRSRNSRKSPLCSHPVPPLLYLKVNYMPSYWINTRHTNGHVLFYKITNKSTITVNL